MARPVRDGFDYFPLDVDFFSDPKIRGIIAHYGTDGVVVYLYLVCAAFRDKGYYAAMNEDLVDGMLLDLKMKEDRWREICKFLLSRKLIDGELMKQGVASSRGMQRRYQEMIRSRARKKSVKVNPSYWLLPPEETEEFLKINLMAGEEETEEGGEDFSGNHGSKSGMNEDKSGNNEGKSGIYDTKKRKGKEQKAKERKESALAREPSPPLLGEFHNISLSEEQLGQLQQKFGDWQERIDRLSVYLAVSGKRYQNHYAVILKWAREDEEQKKKEMAQKGTGSNCEMSEDEALVQKIYEKRLAKKRR